MQRKCHADGSLSYGESEWHCCRSIPYMQLLLPCMSIEQPSESASSITDDKRPLPPKLDDPAADEALFKDEPMVEAPVKADYGFNVKLGEGVFVNFNCVFIDTCPITVGARAMFGPNVSLFSGTHPLDPALRNGIKGPETGKPIVIGEDCWLAGNVTVLPGVTIGKGATVGAGSVVTKVFSQGFLHGL